jgi:sugar phosphate isomerase/epimerase
MPVIKTVFLVCLFALSCCKAAPARAAEALASGTFWQLSPARLAQWSDERLAAEVAIVKNLGMDTILIHYSANWNAAQKTYQTFVPNAQFPLFEGLEKRDPLRAIFAAAEKENIKVILGDFLAPTDLRYTHAEQAFEIWLSPQAQNFRRELLAKFKDSPSLAGYYIANEPNPHRIRAEDKARWPAATRQVAQLVKAVAPDLPIIHSIGLYAQWHPNSAGVLKPSPPSREYLDEFWRPWVEGIPEVDTWMIIDGIGTSLSVLSHTGMAQAWGRELAHGAGKNFWVDVENAVMNTRGYHAFTMPELEKSLQVAARHADKIVLFEHLNYMSPGSSKEASRALYQAYQEYSRLICASSKNSKTAKSKN